LDPGSIQAGPLRNPITGQQEAENISETTERFLTQAGDQVERIKTLIASALHSPRARRSQRLNPTLRWSTQALLIVPSETPPAAVAPNRESQSG
jgi:hypothetical protein